MPITRNTYYGCIPYVAATSFAMPRTGIPRVNGCSCGAAARYCNEPPTPPFPPTPPVIQPFALEGQMRPQDVGSKAWTYDPMFADFQVSQGGFVYLSKIFIHRPTTVNSIMFVVSSAGPLTPGENFAGIYNTAGQRIVTSSDQTTNWQDTSGYISAPIPPTQLAPGAYFIAFLFNSAGGNVGALGTEICTIQGVVQGFESRALQTAAATYTALPAQFVLSDFSTTPTCNYLWAGLA